MKEQGFLVRKRNGGLQRERYGPRNNEGLNFCTEEGETEKTSDNSGRRG